MKTVKEKYSKLIEINKSKFIGILFPVESQEDFKLQLNLINKEWPKATHYCYAYRLNGMEKSNDDGEPSGTAGRPILEFLKNNDLENVALVVVRYFGGIKLGAGGLLRAYIDASKAVFEASNVFLVEEQNVYSLTVDYSLYDILNNYLLKQDGQVLKTEYEMKVSIDYLCSSLDEERINNLLNGQVEILSKGKQKVYIKQ
jgi:uncharacterized YigZ family protein